MYIHVPVMAYPFSKTKIPTLTSTEGVLFKCTAKILDPALLSFHYNNRICSSINQNGVLLDAFVNHVRLEFSASSFQPILNPNGPHDSRVFVARTHTHTHT